MDKLLSKILLLINILLCIIFSFIINDIIKNNTFLFDILNKNMILCYFQIFYFSYVVSFFISIPIIKIFEKIYISFNQKEIKKIDYEYYRDIIKNYSIATICMCYNKKIKYEDQLIATLLKLTLTGKIKVNENDIEILNEDNLSPSEKTFIQFLKGTKVYSKEYILNEISYDNMKDCMKSDLFNNEKSSNIKNITNYLIVFGLILWLTNFVSLLIFNEIYPPIITASSILLHFIILSLLVITNNYNKNILIKNEKGIDIQEKLIGLNNFLKNFSDINNKSINEIYNWEYYMIYAIIFNLKGNLNKEAYKLYKKHLKKLIN